MRQWSVQCRLPVRQFLPQLRRGRSDSIRSSWKTRVSRKIYLPFERPYSLPFANIFSSFIALSPQPSLRKTSWGPPDGDSSPESQLLPLVSRLLYPALLNEFKMANHMGLEEDSDIGRHATFHSIGSQITCIRIFAFGVPLVFGLVSLTASEVGRKHECRHI